MVDEAADVPASDEGTTARERRAQRVKQQARADAPKKAARTIAIVAAIALILAGGVWAYGKLPKSRGSGHEHYLYRMFVDGTEVDFNHLDYDFSTTGYALGHLHLPQSQSEESTSAQYVIHSEVQSGSLGIKLSRFFESLKIQATNSKVTLHPVHDGGRVVENNATHEWQLWVDDCRDDVEGNFHKEGKLFSFEPLQHDRMLLTFAPKDSTVESLTPEWQVLPSFKELDDQLRETCNK